MFTGIIDSLGVVASRTAAALEIRARRLHPKLGASIAVNGCCLTVVSSRRGTHRFDVGPETWRRTSLGALAAGASVNVEPALRAGDEIGGHFVTGHVDAAARVIKLEPWSGEFHRLRIERPAALAGMVAVKGSIAVDGVSLTVAGAGRGWFDIMLVPHTLKNTTLGRRVPGDRVNLEADPLARYAREAARRTR